MSKIKYPENVKLIVGMISAEEDLFTETQYILEQHFGETDFASKILLFNFTDYYTPEMGTGLKRKFISFANLIPPEEISRVKVFTNSIEQKLSIMNKRRINLDPGYVSLSKLVLATTKDHAHRIYLKDGIYAEVTLRFISGSFQPWEWTYPDYRTKDYIEIFNYIRKLLLDQRKIQRTKGC
jgi:hypothetical protein